MIWLQPREDAFWRVAERLARAIGGKVDGIEMGTIAYGPKGAFAVTNWRPDYATAELHAAGQRGWITRTDMRDLMEYMFRQLGCQAVMMRTDARNDAACRVLRRHGLDEVLIPHARGYGRPEAVFVLTRDKASRFLGD